MSASVTDLSVSRRAQLDQLRKRMAAIPGRGESVAPAPLFDDSEAIGPGARQLLPVPPALAGLFPYGGLARGSVVSVSGARSLLLGLLAAVTSDSGHAAVIGHPKLGLLAAFEMGVDLRRLALIPDPGPDPVEVAAVLLDGMDLVVLGLGGASVAPSRARAVVARARSKGSTLVVTDGRWDGVEIRLDAQINGYDGVGLGHGRLRSLRLAVRAQGRAFAPRTARLDLCCERGRVHWMPEHERSTGVPVPVPVPVPVVLPQAVAL